MSLRFYYDPSYNLGAGLPVRSVHGFVLDRPARTRAALVDQHGVAAASFLSSSPIDVDQLRAVHDEAHVASVRSSRGIAAAVEMKPLEWLPSLVSRRAVLQPQLSASGGTSAAMMHASSGGWAINLGGGYHHARPNRAHGFCLVNDVALAVTALRKTGAKPTIAIIDLDAHQGDGNAAAFDNDDQVYTLSVHEESLFPTPKLVSSMDVGLPGGMGDGDYLGMLDEVLALVATRVRPDIVVYIAGVDIHRDDPLSTMALSADGLVRRDERVARFAREHQAGLVVLPAGGYTGNSPGWSAAGMAAIAGLAP
jgi:histone deacetylase 11